MPPTAVVIGAGPGGLIALHELLAAGVDATCYEASACLGGVYASHRVYEGALLTTSSNMVAYGCYPPRNPGPDAPVMWTAEEYVEYLTSFAQEKGLLPRIRFGARVTRVEVVGADADGIGGSDADGVQVTVQTEGGATASANSDGGTGAEGAAAMPTSTTVLRVDHVVVASGLNTHMPPDLGALVPGLPSFTGEVLHTGTLRGAHQLADRRVLIVGGGESGGDVCLMASRVAAATTLSTRSGPGYIIPRYAFGLPSDVDTCRSYHSLPRWLLGPQSRWRAVKLWLETACLTPRDDVEVLAEAARINAARGRGPFERFGCKNTSIPEAALRHGMRVAPGVARFEAGPGDDAASGRVTTAVFTDGSTMERVDVVLLATGFVTRFPFLEAAHPGLAAALRSVRRTLFKRTLHPALGTRVTFCGFARPGLGAIPPVAEMQARLIAGVISGAIALPPPEDQRAAIAADAAADVATFPDDAGRVGALTDYAPLMDGLAGLVGCRPSLPRLLLTGRWRLAWKVLFSSLSGAQFRLHGPGAAWDVAAPAVAAYPTLPLPVLLWEAGALAACTLLGGLLRLPAWAPLMHAW